MSLKLLLLLPVALISATLSGCNSPVGVSADTSVTSDVGSGRNQERGKSIDAGMSTKQSIATPSSGLIAAAAAAAAPALSITDGKKALDWTDMRKMQFKWITGPEHWTPDAFGTKLGTSPAIARMTKADHEAEVAKLKAMVLENPIVAPVVEARLKCAELALKDGTTPEVLACYTDFYRHGVTLVNIMSGHMPVMGMEVSEGSSLNGGYGAASLMTGNALGTWEESLSVALGATTLHDPDAAEAEILKTVMATPVTVLAAASDKIADATWADLKKGIALNISGSQKCVAEWNAGASNVCLGQTGITLTRNGQVWVGNGTSNGKTYNLALESSAGTTLSQKSSGSHSTSNKTAESTKASVDLK